MKVWTAQYRYPGPHRLDITVKGKDPVGKVFAPTWPMVTAHKNTQDNDAYIASYHKMMSSSYTFNRKIWEELLDRDYVVLVCFCAYGKFCHRHLLSQYLVQLGAENMGEITNFTKWKD
jgi:hypothetical protein